MNYIGMDTHIATLEFAVVNERGICTQKKQVITSAKNMIDFIKSIPRPRTLYLEEGSLAAWVVDTCKRFNENVIVSDPKINHWIGHSDEKNDPIDSLKLAHLARGNYIKPIHHATGERRRFRELILYYHDSVKSQTRIKNKIKDKFRQNGIQCTGETVYNKLYQNSWLTKLPKNDVVHFMVKQLWKQLEEIQKCIIATKLNITKFKKIYPEIKIFEKLPGIGQIHASTISAILETPHRFINKRKVWKYAGFGIVKKQSSNKVYYTKLSNDYNRLLKHTIKQAVQVAIRSKENPFRQKYIYLTQIKNISSKHALLTISRSLLAVILAIWKKGEKYNEKLYSKLITT